MAVNGTHFSHTLFSSDIHPIQTFSLMVTEAMI